MLVMVIDSKGKTVSKSFHQSAALFIS